MAATSTVAILPPAETTFLDDNGVPLALGTVTFYIPSTSTPKDTWQNSTGTILNTNPVTLDAAGRALIWGFGPYRQLVKDSLGNTIWDQVTNYTVPTGTLLNIRLITSTGVYTPTTGTTAVYAIICGAGGGGGGCALTTAGQVAVGGGGGAGGYATSYLTTGFSGVTITIGAAGAGGAIGTIGSTGGTTSFGGLFQATGGTGGGGGPAVASASLPQQVFGGNGGVGSSGNIIPNATGGAGNIGFYITTVSAGGNDGGLSFFNSGGAGLSTVSGRVGIVGGYGSGGSGAANTASQGAGHVGGAGGAGVVQIWEYS